MQLNSAAFGTLWFLLWTLFSFFAHYFARNTIRSDSSPAVNEQWLTVLLLTVVQLGVGFIVLKIFLLLNLSSVSNYDNISDKDSLPSPNVNEPCKPSMYLAHAAATLATNASIAFVNTGSAFTIKSFEPITTAVLTSMLLGSRLETHVVVALPLVVTGALGFVWQSTLQSTATFGLGMAFISNLLFGVRNINLKLLQRDAPSMTSKLQLLQAASITSVFVLLAVVFILMFVTSTYISHFDIFSSVISGLFHVTYTIISTCLILKYTSVVGHATANLLKRILVAAIFYMIGRSAASTSNWLMGALMLVGLTIYICPKIFPFNGV